MAKRRVNSPQPRTALKLADERRRADRLHRAIPIYYRWGERPYEKSEAVNFSRTGARVRLRELVEPASRILLQFDLEPKLKLTVNAEMVWQEESEAEEVLAGLRFALPPEIEQRLEKWLKKQFKRAS